MNLVILATVTRFLLPLLLLFSVVLLLRGHNNPGGGFVGGLVAAASFALHAAAFGVEPTRRLLVVNPRTLLGAGLLVALASALVGPLTGRPLMTGLWGEAGVPGLGQLHVGTPLLFDVGVYLVVLGTTLTIILSLEEE